MSNEVENANTSGTNSNETKKHKLEWFVVHAYSGFEAKAKQTLEERIRQSGLTDQFGDIHVPQETVVELVKGQKKTSSRKFFPGYILVQMALNQDTWHLVKETPKITGFVGDAKEPSPLSLEEVQRITNQVEEGSASPRSKISFEQGETVKVTDGPFAEFSGTVEEVKADKQKIKVSINIFGRATPVELDFMQVEKC
jgi:transcriptional antiterminator NusG